MEAIEHQDKLDTKLTEAIRSIYSYDHISCTTNELRQKVLNYLKEALNDEWDYISYYVHDLDWGKKAKQRPITYQENGEEKTIVINSLSILYDFITQKQ